MTDIRQIEPYGFTFYENRELPLNVRMAMASRETAKYCSLSISENFLCYTSSETPTSGMGYNYSSGVWVNEGRFRENAEKYPEHAELLNEICGYIRDYSTGMQIGRHQDSYQKELASTGACWGGGWAGHSNPDYDFLLHAGTSGIRKRLAQYRPVNPDESDFYDGCEIMMDALDILGDRFRALALSMSENETDDDKKSEYLAIARTFDVIPKNPAYDMRSAALLFWMVFTFDGIDS
ncbi:MAG: hypothetical protein IKI93_11200, partial [Clostridia bacterium]|nr:hypothetical protein [Clostridia bacterium]